MERVPTGPVTSPSTPSPSISTPAPFLASEAMSGPSFTGVLDEYNPAFPNDYDKLMEKKQKEKDRERRRDNEER